jgi:TonB family protein
MVHLGAFASMISGTAISCRFGVPDAFDIPASGASPHVLFELAPPPPLTNPYSLTIIVESECGGVDRTDRLPALIGSNVYDPGRPLKRLPRLCARIGSDGHVLAARILRSSGRLAADREVEAQARRLLFEPAIKGTRAVPVTVTLDVIGSYGLPMAADPAPELIPPVGLL